MDFDVICCGESALKYSNTGNITIGVNDCNKIYPVDYLVCVDLPSAFSKERFKTILNSKPKKFFSQLREWDNLVNNYEKIEFVNGSGLFNDYDKKICYSNNSPFVACVMAYKLGARRINLYGADFNSHPNFIDVINLKKTLKDFNGLNKVLLSKGCNLYVTQESKLSAFINVMAKSQSLF